jgi:hypothetical protein
MNRIGTGVWQAFADKFNSIASQYPDVIPPLLGATIGGKAGVLFCDFDSKKIFVGSKSRLSDEEVPFATANFDMQWSGLGKQTAQLERLRQLADLPKQRGKVDIWF